CARRWWGYGLDSW
nr:immunoglobulin heavy chain junction region [Macaca mulatta]